MLGDVFHSFVLLNTDFHILCEKKPQKYILNLVAIVLQTIIIIDVKCVKNILNIFSKYSDKFSQCLAENVIFYSHFSLIAHDMLY